MRVPPARHAVVIGAGIGGLAAAIRLRQAGLGVTLLEARGAPGGLASGEEREGFRFDAGPYVLLDRPGLSWALGQLGLDLDQTLALRRLDPVYEVSWPDRAPVVVHASAEETAAGFERQAPGAARAYLRFVAAMEAACARILPLQRLSRPGPGALLRGGAWRALPLLLGSLEGVLSRSGLPPEVCAALAIWTHVAGQPRAAAPGPMALVPALIHRHGAWYPEGGISALPAKLLGAARASGVSLRFDCPVRAIRTAGRSVTGVETEAGEVVAADAVIANASGLGTYLELLASTPARARRRLSRLPLQSPGLCAYLALGDRPRPPYLRFRLGAGPLPCRLLVRPAAVDPGLGRDGLFPARLVAPLDHAVAEVAGAAGQEELLDRLLAEGWWREGVEEVRILGRRRPVDWGREFRLHRDAMNPVMTAAFMRRGRLAHRSPWLDRLYLAGSATHPGQWVSFCAISGILAADRLREDLT